MTTTPATTPATPTTALSANFLTALNFVLKWEGKVNENVPGDPGQATHWGITQDDDNAYRREHGLPIINVFAMTEQETNAVYSAHYWSPIHGDSLPYPLALTLFDSAVNVGLGRAVTWLQKVVGVDPDGQFGPNTLAAVTAYVNAHGTASLCAGILTRRETYYRTIGAPGTSLNKFLKGWLARTADLRKVIGAQATDQAG